MKQALVNHRWSLIVPDQIADWDAITGWERKRFASMEEHLRPRMTLFDIGAEHGWISAILASFVAPENMVLVEPCPEMWANIRLIWQDNRLADPRLMIQALVDEEGGPVPPGADDWPECAGGPEHPATSYRYLHEPKHANETPILSIDTIAQTVAPDAITIDVEGAELRVLRGARSVMLERCPLIWVSIHPDLMERDYDATPAELHDFMDGYGYDGTHLGTDHEEHWLFQTEVTSYTAVLPYAWRPYRDEFFDTCRLDVLEVDNTETNLGIMRSHNLGIDKMRADGTDWLVIVSAAIRFGPAGGLDFIDHLDRMAGHHVVEAAGVYGWHLIAFARHTLNAVGRWDENFTPYGFDDLDMAWRIATAFGLHGQFWDKVPVDLTDAGMAHSIHLAGVWVDPKPLMRYYRRKWGGLTGKEYFARPFGDPTNQIGYWPEAANGGKWDE